MAPPTTAEQHAWPYIFGSSVLIIAALAAFANGLTLLALRRRHGLHHILGTTTFLLLRCSSTVDLLNALVGLPSVALDKILGDQTHIPPFWCGVLALPYSTLYTTGFWYLTVIALVRLLLVLWPVRVKRCLTSKLSNIVLCAAPVALSLFPQVYGFAKRSMRFGRYSDQCVPIPYDQFSVDKFIVDYQLVALVSNVLVPIPTTLAAYVIIYIVLLCRHRRQQRAVSNVSAMAMAQLDVSITAAAVTTKSAVVTANVATAATDPYTAQYRRRRNVLKILAGVYACNLVCALPLYVLWLAGFYDNADKTLPHVIASDCIQLLYMMALPLNAIAYGFTSKDFKEVYKRILRINKWTTTKFATAAATTAVPTQTHH